MKLYGANQSPFVQKARVVLEEKGIPYETENLIPVPKTPELLALTRWARFRSCATETSWSPTRR